MDDIFNPTAYFALEVCVWKTLKEACHKSIIIYVCYCSAREEFRAVKWFLGRKLPHPSSSLIRQNLQDCEQISSWFSLNKSLQNCVREENKMFGTGVSFSVWSGNCSLEKLRFCQKGNGRSGRRRKVEKAFGNKMCWSVRFLKIRFGSILCKCQFESNLWATVLSHLVFALYGRKWNKPPRLHRSVVKIIAILVHVFVSLCVF